MIIIDEHKELADFVENLQLDATGVVRIDSTTLELSQALSDELVIIHSDIYKKSSAAIQAKIESFSNLIIFDEKSQADIILPNVIAVVNSASDKSVLKNLITNTEDLLREKEVLRSQMISINNELSETMENVEVELLRIKKMYEVKTPRRFQDIKGIQVYSKYSAGESIGGEFFDIYMEEGKLFVLMSATSSYLASSSILQFFAQFKQKKNITEEAELELIQKIKEEVQILNKSKKKQVELNLFTAIIDLNKHTVEGHLFGQFKVLSSAANNFSSAGPQILQSDISEGQFSRTIDRGERIFLCSPGFVKNWERLNPEFMIDELMLNKNIKALDILDEAFFQLKKESQTGFLSCDASAIILEVQKNAMVQV